MTDIPLAVEEPTDKALVLVESEIGPQAVFMRDDERARLAGAPQRRWFPVESDTGEAWTWDELADMAERTGDALVSLYRGEDLLPSAAERGVEVSA